MELLQNIKEIEDFKFFGWKIYPVRKNKKGIVNWEDFMKRLKFDSNPRQVTNIEQLNDKLSKIDVSKVILPTTRRTKNQRIVFWEYPYTVPPVIACYVAAQRSCPMKNVSFLVHGSVLGILSRVNSKNRNEHIMVQRLGGGNVINIRIVVDANGNLGDAGHQFEKLVVGEDINARPILLQDQHLRLIEVGPYKILVCAEVDAIDPKNHKQVEVKSKNYLAEKAFDRDKAKLLFQMISNGSETLITSERTKGEKGTFAVDAVKKIAINEIINSFQQEEGTSYVNGRIDTAVAVLGVIQERIKESDDKCYELTFDQDKINLALFEKGSENSKCKKTQKYFQQLNSDLYRKYVIGQEESLKDKEGDLHSFYKAPIIPPQPNPGKITERKFSYCTKMKI